MTHCSPAPQNSVKSTVKLNNRGVSLVELMIAVFIIVLAISSLIGIIPMLFRRSTGLGNRYQAFTVAKNTLERIRALPWGASVSDKITDDITVIRVIEGRAGHVTFKIKSLTFEPGNLHGLGPDPDKPSSKVTVVIEWDEGTGPEGKKRTQAITYVGSIANE